MVVKVEFLADLDDVPNQTTVSFDDCEFFGAINLRGTGFASQDWEARRVTAVLGQGAKSIDLRVATLPAYLLAKVHAARGRGLEKDWYDIAYVLLHNDDGGPVLPRRESGIGSRRHSSVPRRRPSLSWQLTLRMSKLRGALPTRPRC
jgi:hypothetical protein